MARCPLRLIGRAGRRRLVAEQQVDVLQVLAEEVVEQGILGAGVIVAEPPEPVAALGDVDLLATPGRGFLGGRCFSLPRPTRYSRVRYRKLRMAECRAVGLGRELRGDAENGMDELTLTDRITPRKVQNLEHVWKYTGMAVAPVAIMSLEHATTSRGSP